MPATLTAIALAGAFGTLCRFGLGEVMNRWCGSELHPWGILAANVLGSLLAGLLWMLFETKSGWKEPWALPAFIGFLGAFTTFSTVMLEAAKLMAAGSYAAALGVLALQNVSGLAAALGGIWLGRVWFA